MRPPAPGGAWLVLKDQKVSNSTVEDVAAFGAFLLELATGVAILHTFGCIEFF